MTRHDELVAMLKALKLPAMATFFYEVVRAEREQREQRQIDRLQHQSG